MEQSVLGIADKKPYLPLPLPSSPKAFKRPGRPEKQEALGLPTSPYLSLVPPTPLKGQAGLKSKKP